MKNLVILITFVLVPIFGSAQAKEQKDSQWISCLDGKKCYEINLNYVLLIIQELGESSIQLTSGHLTCDTVKIKEGRHCFTKEQIKLLEKGVRL